MWWEFLIGVAACLLALYGPGWLLLRSARMDSVLALASAPLGSLFGYALLGVLFGEPGIACSWVNTWALSGAVFGAARAASRLLAKGRAFPSAPSGERGLLLLYIAAGTAVCLCVFVSGLDDAASYYCRYDNQTHYTLARHFADSGDWSTLHDWTGSLADDHRSGYYPSAWHALAVLVHSLTGLELPLAFNALNATLAGIVFPASMYALMRALFPLRRSVRAAGALASASFACLPWVFLLKGQLLANLTSIAVMPAAIGLVICYAENGALRHWRMLAFASIMATVDFAYAHPNGLFASLVFLAPFIIHRIAQTLKGSQRLSARNPLRKRWVIWGAGALFAYAAWQLMLYAPPLQSVVFYNNTGNLNLTWPESLYATLGLSLYPAQPMQWLLMAVCIVGFVALGRQRRFWLALPSLWMLFVYGACRCVDAPYVLRTFLAGFWYSDPYRILCYAELFLVPRGGRGAREHSPVALAPLPRLGKTRRGGDRFRSVRDRELLPLLRRAGQLG